MKGKPHTLFPIGIHGGAQRRMDVAMGHGSIRITAGERICGTCDRITPFVRCHHRILHPGRESMPGEVCGGVAQFRSEHVEGRRRGRPMTVALTELLEDAQIRLGLDRLPKIMKAVKGLMSKDQTPEPIEKGYLRAMHEVPVFRDGTIRFDMSDVPITHFTPKEIVRTSRSWLPWGTSWMSTACHWNKKSRCSRSSGTSSSRGRRARPTRVAASLTIFWSASTECIHSTAWSA